MTTNQPRANDERSEMLTNEVRAYIVHATPEQMYEVQSIMFSHACAYENRAPLTLKAYGKIRDAYQMDIDALRLVLDAANCHRETMDERANDPRTLDDAEARKEADALGDAIAKIEALI